MKVLGMMFSIVERVPTPDDIIFDWLQEKAYPDHPLGRTILGAEERVRGFAKPDLERFVDQYYRPGQMVLSAAGAVDHDALVRMAEDMFGDMIPSNVIEPPVARFAGGETRHVKDLEQAHFALAFETPGYRDDEIYTAQIYSTALGGGMSSRLFQEARERRGLCYTIFAQTGAYADTGLTTIYAGTAADQIGDLAGLTIDELKRAADDMSDAEIARARAQMKAGLLMGLESPSARAERLARLVSIWGRVPSLDEVVEKIDAVGTDRVTAFAEKVAGDARAALTMYGPVDHAPRIADLRERLAA